MSKTRRASLYVNASKRAFAGALAAAQLTALSGCAILHSAELGEIDSRVVSHGRRFQVLVSETGFNLNEAAGIMKAVSRNGEARKAIGSAEAIIGIFQMGPRTGNQVFSDDYADGLQDMLRKECPTGRVSGLTSIRETAKYPVVSGEIVKLTGYCLADGV